MPYTINESDLKKGVDGTMYLQTLMMKLLSDLFDTMTPSLKHKLKAHPVYI